MLNNTLFYSLCKFNNEDALNHGTCIIPDHETTLFNNDLIRDPTFCNQTVIGQCSNGYISLSSITVQHIPHILDIQTQQWSSTKPNRKKNLSTSTQHYNRVNKTICNSTKQFGSNRQFSQQSFA